MRILAVDWSGKADGGRETIWIAEVREGRLAFLENGRSRDQVVEFLLEAARGGEPMVVGLDFAFSFPEWYVREEKCKSAPELWARMNKRGEKILATCPPPFWGLKGSKKPLNRQLFRRTEARSGDAPKSVFQIAGSGAVGTGSIRGMPALHALREGGFAIWPFEDAGRATIIEIYPRALTGAVVKSSATERLRYLDRWPALAPAMRGAAASTEDAFDAAVSALVMWAHRAELTALAPARDETDRLEGVIWRPPCAGAASCSAPGCARTVLSRAATTWMQHVEALAGESPKVRIQAARMLLQSVEEEGAA